MKLHQHFILNFLFIFITTLLLSGAVSYFAIKEINTNQQKDALILEIKIIKIQLSKVKNLQKFTSEIKKNTNHRLTLVSSDGKVISESDFNIDKMENHKNRKEIKMTATKDFGYAIRHSKTLNKDFLYVASKYTLKDKQIFIRLSMELNYLSEKFYDMWLKIILIFAVSILFGLYIINILNKKIANEIKSITNSLNDISKKNYKCKTDTSFVKEFFEIKSHIKKLCSRLQKREKQKRKYNAKIRLVSKQRSDIISAISHEFKNPIASVMGYSQTLMDDLDANEKIRERFLAKIFKNAKKISYMIDRLSLAIKFENGDFTPKKSNFDLSVLADEIVNDFKDKNPTREITFIGKSLKINADSTMIEMVIVNLIENALKYSQDEITIEIENNSLHVKDSGMGIAHDEIEKVTNKFYRSNTSSWDNSIGLGLAIVKYILNLHDSELKIKSEFGVGSDFWFEFA